MLTQHQKAYLEVVKPEKANQIIHIKPFNLAIPAITQRVLAEIRSALPQAPLYCMGSYLLDIAGENDIDIYIAIEKQEVGEYISILDPIFLKRSGPDKSQTHLHKWYWEESGCEVNVYLSDKNDPWFKEHLVTFDLLKNSPLLVKEYEALKLSLEGVTWREYKMAKMQFYNKILGLTED